MSYSLDFRRRVFALKAKKGLTFEQTSQYFGIGIRTLFRWQQCIEPCATRNKPVTKIDEAGSVIVMDNVTFHKRKDMIEAITKKGAILEYLSPYSPD